jgi:ornithine carbamoyltransferase
MAIQQLAPRPGTVTHLLSISDLRAEEIRQIVDRGVAFARGADGSGLLANRVIGTYFRKTSTRTRTAFSSAALRLGAHVIAYGPHDLQENTGETFDDTGRVFVGMLDALVARTAGPPQELRRLARQPRMAVVNAMTSDEHPTQALADLTAMELYLGGVEGLHVLYLGEGNNTAAALTLALSHFRECVIDLRTPPGYGLDPAILERARGYASRSGARIGERHDLGGLPSRPDVVYTTRWQTTGTTKLNADWRTRFLPFRVTEELMGRLGKAILMHDLPANRGEEVEAAVLDGPCSIAFEQANSKLHGAMAVLEWCLRGGQP